VAEREAGLACADDHYVVVRPWGHRERTYHCF
jgi:hypothetical protein